MTGWNAYFTAARQAALWRAKCAWCGEVLCEMDACEQSGPGGSLVVACRDLVSCVERRPLVEAAP